MINMASYYLSSLCVTILVGVAACESRMSWDAKEVLLNLADDLGINNICDSKFKIQGPLPSMTQILDKTAERNKESCALYYMISPDVTMLCENEDGHVVATSRDEYINFESEDLKTKYRYIEENLEMLAADWRLQAEEIQNSAEWVETEPSIFPDADNNSDDGDEEPKVTSEQDTILVPGDSARLALDDEDITISVATDLMVDHEDKDSMEWHELLCHIINICDPSNPTSVDKSKIKETAYGQKYIEIYVLENANEFLESDLAFEIDVQTNGMQIKRRYFIDIQMRIKRRTTITIVGRWRYYSIDHESLFPDYGQYMYSTKPALQGRLRTSSLGNGIRLLR